MGLLLLSVGIGQSWSVSLGIINLCLISAIMSLGVNIQWGYAGLFNAGIMGLITSGLGGFIFRNQILGWIEKIYQLKKYETLAAFNKQKI